MRFRRVSVLLGMVFLVGVVLAGLVSGGGLARLAALVSQPTPAHPNPGPQPYPDAYKVTSTQPRNIVVPGGKSPLLPHPCGGMAADPPYSGVSPLSIAYVPGMCNWGYGDIAVWQAGGHSYVAQSGFEGGRMYHIWNVDDPYSPLLMVTKPFPTGGTASTAIFHFHQYGHEYIATTMRGSGTGCGYFIDNVDNPGSPVAVVTGFRGADWCTVHETFVSTNASGDADYAWLTMSGESGSGYKIVAVTLPNLSQSNVLTETGRYQRPDSCPSLCIFAHDSNVVGNRVYIAHWQGGAIIEDKETLAHNINPTPLNPIDSIRPSNFWVHHLVPTTDSKFLLIEDEFLNQATAEKIKLYNIEDLSNPSYVEGITGGDPDSNTSQAHNQIIKNLGPHHDLLLSAFYLAGYRLYDLDTSGTTPVITQVGKHQLRATGGQNFGGVWGVDSLPCTVRGVATTCIYSSDMMYGLVVDALGVNPAFDPYPPDAHITSPTNGQEITTCTFSVQGTGHDYWSGLSHVQVSTNGGTTWADALGTTTWSYQWNIQGAGQYVLQVRGVDQAGNVETPTVSVTVNVTANCPLTTATLPPTHTPTITSTPVPPTNTSTATNTAVPESTDTATSTATSVVITPEASSTPEPSATPPDCSISFSDVPEGNVFYPYVHCLVCLGIINGYSDGTFRPENSVTRGQLSKIVSNAAGFAESVSGQAFEDVLPGSTFYTYTERLYSREVMSGYVCGGVGEPCGVGNLPYFRPNHSATRGQISKIVSQAAGYNDPAGAQMFEDVPPGSTFYDYVQRLASRQIMRGYQCGGPGEECNPQQWPYFRPSNNATRGQVAKSVSNTFFPECSPTNR